MADILDRPGVVVRGHHIDVARLFCLDRVVLAFSECHKLSRVLFLLHEVEYLLAPVEALSFVLAHSHGCRLIVMGDQVAHDAVLVLSESLHVRGYVVPAARVPLYVQRLQPTVSDALTGAVVCAGNGNGSLKHGHYRAIEYPSHSPSLNY